tara:strand:- start:1459 stop:2013 length:555 start_codon:yes stop_codon:yes gene_type:complete
MKKYDLEVANMLCNYFSELTGFELGGRGRTPKESYLRALLYRVLKDLNDMNDRAIARHFTEVVGDRRNRSSIYHAFNKMDTYYKNHEAFRDYYDVFFKDKVKDREREEARENRIELRIKADEERLREITLSKMVSFVDSKRIEINNMIAEVPDDKIQEIRDLMSLRIKSWSWKAKNEYEIIEYQ